MSDMNISDGEIEPDRPGEHALEGDRRDAEESTPLDAGDAEEGELGEGPYRDQSNARSIPLLDAEIFLTGLSKTLEEAGSQDSEDAMEVDSDLAASDNSLRDRESEIWEGTFKNNRAKSRSRSSGASGASGANPRSSVIATELDVVGSAEAAPMSMMMEEDALRQLVASEPDCTGGILSIKKGLHSPGILSISFEVDARDAERVARWSKRRESAE